MTLKEFRDITSDYKDDTVITYMESLLLEDGSVELLESEFVSMDIRKYTGTDGKIKNGKVIILE